MLISIINQSKPSASPVSHLLTSYPLDT